ncbi:TRAP transporter small permease subunit [Pseudomaricurvus alkylphenolicus]|jgi:TRAP-type mannitol/chloroaromatic compound transport system permease small subunit|uniref:TRAP transporter small permease subunit n=1 Tax=Pseudomaricurvus alkylphenolicus TaxID=1306991 RepID=UPI0014230322|nr:TRAP transporter small permease subunit [Pseudomaricurvus alkylphenolicus]NIB39467.1 TRAP transporter small permease subunit [Pseudomaricurvus alkylphenolicus]
MSSNKGTRIDAVVGLIDAFSEFTGRVVAWLTLAMMALTCLIVLLRYGFSIGSIALQESIGYLHAMVFLLGAAFTLQRDGHVRVDIFYRRFNREQQAWVNALGSLLFLLPVSLFILIYSWDFVVSAWRIKEGSPNADGIPAVYLLKSLIPLAAITLSLQGIAEVLRGLLTLTQPQLEGEGA